MCVRVNAHKHICAHAQTPLVEQEEKEGQRSLHWTGWWRSDVSRKRQEANYQSLKRVGICFSPLTRNLGGRV